MLKNTHKQNLRNALRHSHLEDIAELIARYTQAKIAKASAEWVKGIHTIMEASHPKLTDLLPPGPLSADGGPDRELSNATKQERKMSSIEISLVNMGTVDRNKVIVKKDGRVVVLYFSYSTIVAVGDITSSLFCSLQNDWSVTTGRFLNELEPDKSRRVPHSQVLEQAQKCLQTVLA